MKTPIQTFSILMISLLLLSSCNESPSEFNNATHENQVTESTINDSSIYKFDPGEDAKIDFFGRKLTFPVADGWLFEGRETPGYPFPELVIFSPEKDFSILMTSTLFNVGVEWDDEKIKKQVLGHLEIKGVDQNEISLIELKGDQVFGYYYGPLKDKNLIGLDPLPLDQYPYGFLGAFRIHDMLIYFSFMSDKEEPEHLETALEMLQTISFSEVRYNENNLEIVGLGKLEFPLPEGWNLVPGAEYGEPHFFNVDLKTPTDELMVMITMIANPKRDVYTLEDLEALFVSQRSQILSFALEDEAKLEDFDGEQTFGYILSPLELDPEHKSSSGFAYTQEWYIGIENILLDVTVLSQQAESELMDQALDIFRQLNLVPLSE